MENTEFLRALDELLELSPGTLNGAERLEDLESWDSLAVLSFIALMDERFGVTVSPKRITGCATVNDLFALRTAASA